MEKRVIIISGPTCSGKTKLAIELACKLGSEVISADSRQVYELVNIGTAKPSSEELKLVKHHLIGTIKLNDTYNAHRFEKDSLEIIESLHTRKLIPVVAGGTGLYIKALKEGIFDNVDVKPGVREEIMELREKYGNLFIYNMLKEKDPDSAENMLPQNWKRVVRALEIYNSTGVSILKHRENYKRVNHLEFINIGINIERSILYQNIDFRVDNMIEAGLVNETKDILSKGFRKDCNALNTVGYKEIISHLDGEIDFEQAVYLIKRNSRRYAKRQITWFNSDKEILNFSDEDLSNNNLDKILSNKFGI